jgi:hypothetical protein
MLKTERCVRDKKQKSNNTSLTKRKEERRRPKRKRLESLNHVEVVIFKAKIKIRTTSLTPTTSPFFS